MKPEVNQPTPWPMYIQNKLYKYMGTSLNTK